MLTTILAYLLVALFSIGEGRFRQGSEAQAREPGTADRRSTELLGAAYAFAILCLLAAPLLNLRSVGRISTAWASWPGVVLVLCGIALRVWANLTLGRFYTRTLRVLEDHALVQRGPYRLIRHPGYLGTIVMWAGAGLAAANWAAILLVLAVLGLVYYHRIEAEEAMLLERLGKEYADYRLHTWKLVPFLY
jgi:protein-S-isoprenylcysteine O-methyltransferase Ste14